MMRAFLRIACALVFALGAARAADDHKAPHWSYDGAGGPEHWGDLDPAFQTCKTGQEQSPIDIPASTLKPSHLDLIQFDYEPSSPHVTDDGHTIKTAYAPGNSIRIGSAEYALQQMHFHHPAEETIDGRSFPLVAHLVHKSKDGKLAVIAVLFQEGATNQALAAVFAHGKHDLDPTWLLPPTQAYYTFKGSLTTPPCTEGVTWYVLRTPMTASADQIAEFAKYYAHNARPTQPLHGRVIKASD